MPYYERNDQGNIVPFEGDVPQEAITAIERADDAAIIQKMTTGIAASAFIYSYPIQTAQGKKEIIGISTKGAYELAKEMRNVEVLPGVSVDKDSDPDYYYAMVRAKDLTNNVTLLGVARQCKFTVDKGNKPTDRLNDHAFVSAISKAQRNAILHIASEEAVTRIVGFFDKTGGRKAITPPKLQTEKETPAAAPPVTAFPPVATKPVVPPVQEALAKQVEEQQEVLKQLRLEVHAKFFAQLSMDKDKRKVKLIEWFDGAESLTQLSESQLKECKARIDAMSQPPEDAQPVNIPEEAATFAQPNPKDGLAIKLGFTSVAEQKKSRDDLYALLTSKENLGMSDDEAREFVSKKGVTTTTNITKDKLEELTADAKKLIELKNAPQGGLPF